MQYKIGDDGYPYIECLKCGMKSYNANDIKYKYCGKCNIFFDADLGYNRNRQLVRRSSDTSSLNPRGRLYDKVVDWVLKGKIRIKGEDK